MDIYSNYYITQSAGGWSPCIQGNNAYNLRPFNGSVLPNCVGQSVGRFNELMGLGACTYLGNTDARNFMQYCQTQGLSSGMTPAVGACMVWDDGVNGHAAIVEQVNSLTDVVTSESGWNYTTQPIVRSINRTEGNGNWGYNGTFLGFIYLPQPPVPPTRRKLPVWMMIKRRF